MVSSPVEAYGLTPADVEKFTKIFNAYDSDGDGHLTVEELRCAFAGTGMSEAKIRHFVKRLDKDGNNQIELSEFLEKMGPVHHTAQQKQRTAVLRQAFKAFDKNGDNFISPDELRDGLKSCNPDWSDKELDERVAEYMECDTNKDNKINYEEFLDIIVMDL